MLDRRLSVDPSLVLHLPLRRLDGDAFMSRDAYGHLCTNHGSQWKLDGRLFNGSSDYIDCGNNESLDIVDAITVVAGVKLVGGTSTFNKPIVFKGPLTNNFGVYNLGYAENSKEAYWMLNNDDKTLAAIFTMDIWQHIVGTYDKQNMRLCVNETEKVSTPYTTDINTTTEDLLIGKHYSASQPTTHGSVAVARIYNRALGQLEAARFNERRRIPC